MQEKLVTSDQINKIDQKAIKEMGVPSLALMENAGREVAYEILTHLKKNKESFICIVCGLGNNAGDGFVAARHLLNLGLKVKVYVVGNVKKLKKDPAVHYKSLKNLKYLIKEIESSTSTFRKDLAEADCVVDALFGVGLSRDIISPYFEIIENINRLAKAVVSVDVPSGLNATTGQIQGISIYANVTVTFTFAKTGFEKGFGPHCTGEVVVVDIGIPEKLTRTFRK